MNYGRYGAADSWMRIQLAKIKVWIHRINNTVSTTMMTATWSGKSSTTPSKTLTSTFSRTKLSLPEAFSRRVFCDEDYRQTLKFRPCCAAWFSPQICSFELVHLRRLFSCLKIVYNFCLILSNLMI